MGGITPTSSEEEMPILSRQARCRVKVAAPPQAKVRQANYLTAPSLKQFSKSTRKSRTPNLLTNQCSRLSWSELGYLAADRDKWKKLVDQWFSTIVRPWPGKFFFL
jgi:hypothetical protein